MLPISSSDSKPQAAKKFYFLEYFYVLLKGVQQSSHPNKIFEQFLSLKQEHLLGESRYKRLTIDESKSHSRQLVRYMYTFEQVLSEAEEYKLIDSEKDGIFLTEAGQKAIDIYESQGIIEYNRFLFCFMEEKYAAFRFLVEACYNANPEKSGLLIFPVYSAYRLGIERDTLRTSKDLQGYFSKLKIRLEEDIFKYLGVHKDLNSKNEELIESLKNADLLPRNLTEAFKAEDYNVILKRGRDFWLKYFLQDLYRYPYSLNAFETWAYRGRQIGIIHITEFYPDPNFSGRVVYPLSVIRNSSNSENFYKLFDYKDSKSLYLHQPKLNQEEFVKALYNAYLDVRQSARTYFVNLSSVREGVCYNLKIPEYLFDKFLEKTYHERENIKIRISLEVDKLPDETKVMYLRREPVMVDGKYRNIIAIDLRTKEPSEGAIHE